MAIVSSISWSRSSIQYFSTVFTCCAENNHAVKANALKHQLCTRRRVGALAVISSLFLAAEATTSFRTAAGVEFRMTTPEQTAEEARAVIRDHAQALLDVKSLLEVEDWREAQRELRQNSGYLKQDIYAVIQSKEGSIRPLLRKLYFNLFSNVTQLDYAAREKNVARAWECYNNITTILNDILSKI